MKKEVMKPNEIDSIIKSKIQENDGFYDHEIAAAKPFIWAAIRNKITRTGCSSNGPAFYGFFFHI